MTLSNNLKSAAAVIALGIGGSAVPAMATSNAGGATAASYVAAFAPAFGPAQIPFAGTMRLIVSDGTIDGAYTGISVRPDPFYGRIVPVLGTISDDDGVQLNVGNNLYVTGTMAPDGAISGTADYDGGIFAFRAEPGSLRSR